MAQATPPRPPRSQLAESQSQPAAGPSGTNGARSSDLWTDILRSADRQKALPRKNVILLSERHRGRTHLLDKLAGKRRAKRPEPALAIGYDVLQTDDREEDAPPPVSVLYPPSSHSSLVKLLDVSLPPRPLSNTAVVIVLDWTKPSGMVRELLHWLGWVDSWAERTAKRDGEESNELRERLQSHLQRYTEPTTSGAAPSTSYDTLLPLGPGTLTSNPSGIPIIVVCTRADQMDAVGDELGMKGGGWEERTDWIQQVLRTVCLAYGAALFYTASTQPKTYTLLKDYIFHRLYTPEISDKTSPPPSRFPFPHRANVLDRDAVMVPAGWDSWGKINVLREGFNPSRVQKAWEASVGRSTSESQPDVLESDDTEGIEDLWAAMIPDTERPKPATAGGVTTTTESEQIFLQRHFDTLLKDPTRNAHATFKHAAAIAAPSEDRERAPGVVGPMGVGGLNLPGVEKAMAEMEGEDAKEKFARIARRDAKPTSPTPERNSGTNEALHNFFQGLLAKKAGGSAVNTPTKSK